jgi:hypothetical protein
MQPIAEGQVMAIIHTDYYLDLPKILASVSGPVMIYTFQPDRLAQDQGCMSFTFNENNDIKMHFAGGTTYIHKVWDLRSGDTICVTYGRLFKITTLYLISRRKIAKHRYVIFFSPVRRWTCPVGARLAQTHYSKDSLTYLKPVLKDSVFTAMQFQSSQGLVTAIGRVNATLNTVIPSSVYGALMDIANISQNKIGQFHIIQVLKNANVQLPLNELYLLQNFFREYQEHELRVTFDDKILRNQTGTYTFAGTGHKPSINPKPSIDIYMPHFGLSPLAPSDDAGTHHNAITTRIENLQWKDEKGKMVNVSDQLTMTRFMSECINDFAIALFPQPHVLDKYDANKVWKLKIDPHNK